MLYILTKNNVPTTILYHYDHNLLIITQCVFKIAIIYLKANKRLGISAILKIYWSECQIFNEFKDSVGNVFLLKKISKTSAVCLWHTNN